VAEVRYDQQQVDGEEPEQDLAGTPGENFDGSRL